MITACGNFTIEPIFATVQVNVGRKKECVGLWVISHASISMGMPLNLAILGRIWYHELALERERGKKKKEKGLTIQLLAMGTQSQHRLSMELQLV